MVDTDDDFVTEGLVIFTEALDDLVVSWVVEVVSWVVAADASVVAVTGVCTVIPPSCKMNDLQQFFSELNKNNPRRTLGNVIT